MKITIDKKFADDKTDGHKKEREEHEEKSNEKEKEAEEAEDKKKSCDNDLA